MHEATREATLAARVLEVEHRIYPQALRWVAEGRVRIADGRCLIDGQPAATFSTARGNIFPHLTRSQGAASLIHTLLSWKAAPPKGAIASAPVSVLMPLPSAIGVVRPDRFGDQHAAPHALEQPGVQPHLAARVAEHHPAPSAMPSAAGIVGMDHHLGRPRFCARDVGVSLKVELRKPRDGEVARRNGCSSSASSITFQWSGSSGICVDRPGVARRCGTARSASPA